MLITNTRKLFSGSRRFFSDDLRRQVDPLKGDFQDFLQHVSVYEEMNKDVLNPYFMQSGRLPGFATEAGTEKYYRRSQGDNEDGLEVHPAHFRSPLNSLLKLTSLGYGTYVGEPDDKTDYLMYDALKQSVLSGGINVIDTAPNYRYTKSELVVGKVLTTLHSKYGVTRDQMFVASKAGYVPEDGVNMVARGAMIESLVEAGVPRDQFVLESGHCLHPKFLELSLESSLKRLNLDCLDVFYLHNPYEGQGPFNTDNVFFDRLQAAFEFLEKAVEAGKIKSYGLATYSCFRQKPTAHKQFLSL